ncbi:hypothetical protein, partial [Bartonella grahamii]|uniref:hypothetical protein n=1 Tax=Bartonella grahamii TaxID=33045 RepID=UPI001FEFA59D
MVRPTDTIGVMATIAFEEVSMTYVSVAVSIAVNSCVNILKSMAFLFSEFSVFYYLWDIDAWYVLYGAFMRSAISTFHRNRLGVDQIFRVFLPIFRIVLN